jgi:hypothetical protein
MTIIIILYVQEEGKQFDVIFGDLTDIPIRDDGGAVIPFVKSVLEKSFALLPVGMLISVPEPGARTTQFRLSS